MKKFTKRLIACIIAAGLLIGSIPLFAVSADTQAAGAFLEDFGGFTAGTDIAESGNRELLNGLKVWYAGAGTAAVIAEEAGAGNGKALRLKDVQLHTKTDTPGNFKLEYRFKVTDTGGDWATFFNWLGAPDSGNGEGGPMFGYDPLSWRGANCHFLQGWDMYNDSALLEYGSLGDAWTKLTITFYNGVYTLYLNEKSIGSRDFGARANGGLHLKINTLEMYIDYIEVAEYNGENPFDGGTEPVAGAFREDFNGLTNISDIAALKREGSDGTVAIAAGEGVGGSDALKMSGWTVMQTAEAAPESFMLEYVFRTEAMGNYNVWFASPVSGEGTAKSNPLFTFDPTPDPPNWRGPNYNLLSGWDNFDGTELYVQGSLGTGWIKVTVTFHQGIYTLYINEEKIGERDFGARANGKHLRFQTRYEMDMLFDCIEVKEFDGVPPYSPVVLGEGEFNDDFGDFDAGTMFSRDENNLIGGLRVYDEGFNATAEVVNDENTANGKALRVDSAYIANEPNGNRQYKSFTLITKEKVPENFQLEYRFKVTDGNGDWRELVNWLNATDIYGDWDPNGAAFTYSFGASAGSRSYYLQREYNTTANELRRPAGAFDFNDWHTVKITYWKGTYTLYMDGQLIGERNYGTRTEDFIRFRIGTINMYIDYIKLESYEETSEQPASLDISFDKPGHIFDTSEITEFDLVYESNKNNNVTVDLSYVVRNHKNVIVQQGVETGVSVAPMGKLERTVALNQVTGTGLFKVMVSVDAGGGNIISESAEFSRVFPVIQDRAGSPFGIGTHLIGASDNRVTTSLDLVELGGLSVIRGDFAWQSAETSLNGPINIPQAWHNIVDKAMERGIEPLMIFSYGNTHYESIDPGMRLRGIPITEEGRQAYARFCYAVVEAFAPKGVQYFNVWNEPNHEGGGNAPFNPNGATPEEYTLLMKAVYEKIKPDFPDIVLICGSTAPFGSIVATPFYQRVLAAGGVNYADAFAVHPYTYSGGASGEDRNLVGALSSLDTLIRSYNNNVSIPIWVTEMGWPTHVGDRNGVSEEVSASYMVRSWTQMLSLDFMEKFIWYNFMNNGNNTAYNEDNFGTVRYWSDPVLPWGAKASYITQNVMANLLHKAEYTKSATTSRQYLYQFRRADGKDVLVAWDTLGQRSLSLNAGEGEFNIYDMYGNKTTVQAVSGKINIILSEQPIYIEGQITGDLTTSAVFTDWAAEFKPAYEDGEWYLETVITNIFQTELSGTVSITEPASFAGAALPFAAAADSAAVVKIPVANPGQGLYNITVTAEAEGYSPATATRATSFLYAQKTTAPISVDGVLNAAEWDGAQVILVDTAGDTRSGTTTAPISGWGGPDDLSMKIMTKWDDDNLYMAIEVKDDIHHQTESGYDIWSGDGIQFSFDPGRADGVNSLGYNELGMALTNSGSIETFRWAAAHGSDGAIDAGLMNAAIVRDEDAKTTTYEAAVSWELLLVPGINAELGSLFGLSVLANENDGTGRRGWIQYMEGIGGGKAPELFGDLVLIAGAAGFTPEAEALRDALEAVSGLLVDVKAVLAKPRGTNITANLWANALTAFVPRLEAFDAAGDAWDGEESVVIDGITFAAADVNNWIVNVKNIYNLLNAIV